MKRVTKRILNKINDYNLDVKEKNDTLFIKTFFGELNLDITIGLGNIKIEDNKYRVDIYSSGLIEYKDDLKLLNTLNKINKNCPFSKFIIDEDNYIHLYCHIVCCESEIEEICLIYLSLILSDIKDAYPQIMKTIWS